MDPTDRHVGRTLGEKYVIVAPLGQGGMGRVYRGVQLSVNRQVAIKLITGSTPHLPEWEQRFRREAQAMAQLSHPNSIRLFDFGVTEAEEPYMVMELLEGVDLARYIADHGPLPLAPTLHIVRQILLALSEAHALGIVHRDIKPDNVFVARVRGGDNIVKVMDFGIAGVTRSTRQHKLTSTGIIIGTPTYMSPEQARGEAVDARSDLYSLGVVLFEMLTCQHPFVSSNAMSVLLAHLTQPARRLRETGIAVQYEGEVQALLDGLLAKQPDARPAIEGALSRVNALIGLCSQSPGGALVVQPARGAHTPTTPAPHHTQHSAEGSVSRVQALRARIRARRSPGLFAGTLILWIGALAFGLWHRYAERATPGTQEPAQATEQVAVPPVAVRVGAAKADAPRSIKLVREDKPQPEATPPKEPHDEHDSSKHARTETFTEHSAAVDPNADADAYERERERGEQAVPPGPAPTSDPVHIDPGVGDINYAVPAWRQPLTAADDLPVVRNSPERALRHAFARVIGRITVQPPSPARREELLRRGILYPNVRGAWLAYDSGAIDRGTFHEAIWLLRERRRQRTQTADDDYAHRRTTRAQYTRQYELISVEFWGE